MPRFFIEISYKGTQYSGFQKQENANSVQAEVEKALSIYFRESFELTGSSRTDAGVHALQNYFHFDADLDFSRVSASAYHLNAILPAGISIQSIRPVIDQAHCRFDAASRLYEYRIYRQKNPFLQDSAYYFPYKLDKAILDTCARELFNHTDFEAFSKRNSQVFTYNCTIITSEWTIEEDVLIYRVEANRFLRGMVKGLVGTMLKMSTKQRSLEFFSHIISSKNSSKADFTPPSHGLFLKEVRFPASIFI